MVLRRLVARPEALDRVRVRVDVSREPGASLLGRVSTLDAAGRSVEREVADDSCDALVHALSLVVALSVDDVPPAEAFADMPPLRRSISPPARDGWGDAPFDGADVDLRPQVPAAPGGSFGVEPMLRAAVQSAFGPTPAVGFGLGVAFEHAGAGLWSPRMELTGMVFDGPSTALSVPAVVQVDALVLSASLCPVQLAGVEPWSLRPCVDLDAGRMTVSGSGGVVTRAEERHAPWLSSGLSLHVGVAPWGGPLQISASLGGFLPLARHEFYFAPDIAAFEVPAAGWRAASALAVTF